MAQLQKINANESNFNSSWKIFSASKNFRFKRMLHEGYKFGESYKIIHIHEILKKKKYIYIAPRKIKMNNKENEH